MKVGKLVKNILGIGAVAGGVAGVAYYSKKSMDKSGELSGRYRAYYQLTNQWLFNKNEDKKVSDYLKENGYKKIAIYGMGTLGELLYSDIKDTDIEIAYFIDKNAKELYVGDDGYKVVGIDDIESQDRVDAIIVTPVFDYDTICEELEETGVEDIEFVSLENVIYDM